MPTMLADADLFDGPADDPDIDLIEVPPLDELELLPVPAEQEQDNPEVLRLLAAPEGLVLPAGGVKVPSGLRGITRRAEWGWRPGTSEDNNVRPRGVKLHWPGGGSYRFDDHMRCLRLVAAWDRYHRSRGSRAIEYSGVVCQHRYFIECRSTWEHMISRPASNGNRTLNYNHLGFQFMVGPGDKPPTAEEYRAMGEVVAQARRQGCGSEVLGHKDGYGTTCPGPAIYANRGRVRSEADRALGGTPPPPPPPVGGKYTVQPGDTLGAIAARFGVSVAALVAANPIITNPDMIQAGWVLTIPGLKPPPKPDPKPEPGGLDARTVLEKAAKALGVAVSKDEVDTALGVGWFESYNPKTGLGGYLDAVGDTVQLEDPAVDAKWGPSVGFNQYRTLDSPSGHGYPDYDEARDIGVLAGRAPGVEKAPDAGTAEKAALEQAKALWLLVRGRGFDRWTIYRTGRYAEAKGRDYTLRLGYPTAGQWHLDHKPAPKPDPKPGPVPDGHYRVQSGDTLGKIAGRFKVTVADLVAWNNIADPDHIEAGQLLKVKGSPVASVKYTVRKGDYLGKIAKQHGVSVAAIVAANPIIKNPDLLQPGWVLTIPGGKTPPKPKPKPAPPKVRTYKVRSGDTLGGIAQRHGVSVAALMKANPVIRDKNHIEAGWTLTIPGGGGGPATHVHVVKPGDSLDSLAREHGTTWQQLHRMNSWIKNPDVIQAGWKITCPGSG